MSCKYHAFKEALIKRVQTNLRTMAEEDYPYLAHSQMFGRLYAEVYSRYYPTNPETNQIIEMLGLNLDSVIMNFWSTFEEAALSWNEFEDQTTAFVETQFSMILDHKYHFFCCCNGLDLEKPPCSGDGTCLAVCDHPCTCANEVTCICPHQGYFCPVVCPYDCPPRPCRNYQFCNNSMPQWLYRINAGLCSEDCRGGLGLLNLIVTEEQCVICAERPQSVSIFCGHQLCIRCWRRIVSSKPQCPFCRALVPP